MTQNELNGLLNEEKRKLIHSGFLTSIILSFFSIQVAKFGLKKNINPNIITLGMLLSVILALPFFYFDTIWGLIIGFIIIQGFEIFDDADGIVARVSGRLSVYGEQLDYIMHMICHPLAIITFGYAIYLELPQENLFPFIDNLYLIICLCAAFIILEYAIRNFVHLDSLTKLKIQFKQGEAVSAPKISIFKMIINHLILFPFFMQVFPIALGIDIIFNINISIWIFISAICVWCLFVLWQFLKKLIRYMR